MQRDPVMPNGWPMEMPTWDLDLFPGYRGPLAVPGRYTARMKVGDREATTTITVVKDPHSSGTMADIESQVALSVQIRSDIDEVAAMIDELEWTRKELFDYMERARSTGASVAVRDVINSAEELEQYALSVEARLFDVLMTGAREDAFRHPMKLYGRYGALGNDVGNDSADFRPTDQQLEVYDVLARRLEETRALYDDLMRNDVPAFRARLQ